MPEVMFSGADGRLEGRYQPSRNGDDAPVAVILHPHPQQGGDMDNKVVHTLFHVFARRGFSVLRFNFRGVGRSQGTCDGGAGELSDAASALDWLQQMNTGARLFWVAGFSFGAWIGMQLLMRRPELNGFVAVAPPANQHDFTFLAPCPSSGLILHGDRDPEVPHDASSRLAGRLDGQGNVRVDFRLIKGADHGFLDHLEPMARTVDGYLAERVSQPEPAR